MGHGGSSGGAGQKLRISLKERLEYCLGFIGHSQWDQVVPCFTKIASSVSCQREQSHRLPRIPSVTSQHNGSTPNWARPQLAEYCGTPLDHRLIWRWLPTSSSQSEAATASWPKPR